MERDDEGLAVTFDLVGYGRMDLVRSREDYPYGYVLDAEYQANNLMLLAAEQKPDEIVIEESNGGGGRASGYTQKLIEWLHLALLQRLRQYLPDIPVGYIRTSTWRKVVGSLLSKDDKKKNAALARAKRLGTEEEKAAKKRLGIRGKTTKKHVAVRYVNQTYHIHLKAGEHDAAEAIAIGDARLRGTPFSVPQINSRES